MVLAVLDQSCFRSERDKSPPKAAPERRGVDAVTERCFGFAR
ncbi:hypothetical protein B23_3657 [Geobacillus thermoleovorans B23]|nr:hypothetical protein B23_3657 [Geobacillus thermoleovorans B23]